MLCLPALGNRSGVSVSIYASGAIHKALRLRQIF